ncbi:hypothetical protein EI94DRAFT_1740247 [Lactarius quietus]|nr:hypothetical protein EI94DRAFT_1740247 [Lactarius quietus]
MICSAENLVGKVALGWGSLNTHYVDEPTITACHQALALPILCRCVKAHFK